MKLKRTNRMIMVLLLFTLILGQSSLAFAGKPAPVVKSAIDITTTGFTVTIPEDTNYAFSVNLTSSIPNFSWAITPLDPSLTYSLNAVQIKTSKRSTSYLQTANFVYTPVDDDTAKKASFEISASDGGTVNKDQITVTFNVTPVLPPTEPTVFNYVALGDSIPAGVSYENSTTQKIITSYTDQIATDLRNSYDIVNYYDMAVSGLNIYKVGDTVPYDSLYSQVFFDTKIRDSISTANLITLCIGANDIMDAAPRNLTGGAVNFYDINWTVANQGLDNFYAYWDDIIREIYALAPDNVNLVVMNMYNPYRISDGQGNATEHEVYGTGSLYSIVNKYFYSTEDLNPSKLDGIDYGLNYIIENPQTVYADQLQENGLPLGFEKPYKVVNVYAEFEKDQTTKSNWIAFYDNSGYAYIDFFGILIPVLVQVQDPHPTVSGQAVLFDLHKSVIAW